MIGSLCRRWGKCRQLNRRRRRRKKESSLLSFSVRVISFFKFHWIHARYPPSHLLFFFPIQLISIWNADCELLLTRVSVHQKKRQPTTPSVQKRTETQQQSNNHFVFSYFHPYEESKENYPGLDEDDDDRILLEGFRKYTQAYQNDYYYIIQKQQENIRKREKIVIPWVHQTFVVISICICIIIHRIFPFFPFSISLYT